MSQENDYQFFDRLFVRSPFYSPENYAPERIKQVLMQREFQNAIWLASPDFYRLLSRQHFNWDLLGKSERTSVLKYFNRMSFRATPFGAFSAFSLVPWDSSDRLRLVEGRKAILHLLPAREWQVEEELTWKAGPTDYHLQPNPTIMGLGNRFSFIRSTISASGKMDFALNSIPAEELNKKLLAFASPRPVLRSYAVAKAADLTGCTAEEASSYIDFLVNEQVFYSEFEGCLIESPQLAANRQGSRTAMHLPFTDELRLEQVNAELAGQGGMESYNGNLFYSALERPVQEGGVGDEWQQEMIKVIGLLRKIVIPYPTPALKNFVSAFKNKFDEQQIPLLTALDPETGIGYDNLHGSADQDGLLKSVFFPSKPPGDKQIEWTAVHRMFFRLWRDGVHSSCSPLVISEQDLREISDVKGGLPLPPSLAFLFSRTAEKMVLDNNGGASATSILGRFSAFNGEVADLCSGIAAAEGRANPEVIFAELHQLSDTHVDNINRRSPIYDYIIPVNTYAAETGQKTIRLDDLVLSVQGEALVLSSVSLRKRVIPRLPTAFNYHHNQLAIFRMLGDLQYQGLHANLTFDLEKLFPGLGFYPRVEYGKTIITLAKWRLQEKEIERLTSGHRSVSALHLWRQQRGVPAQITMGISDQQLVFDLGADQQALFFLDCLKELKTTLIREYPEPGKAVMAGKPKLAAQFIAVMARKTMVYQGTIFDQGRKRSTLQRSFPPGSEWLYIKIYGTPETSNHLLLSVIRPFVARNQRLINTWFFIRYRDPEPHIRLRINTNATDIGVLITGLKTTLTRKTDAVHIREFRLETYEREIERYSEELMVAAENCFYAGSELAMDWLQRRGASSEAFNLAVFSLVFQMAQLFIPGEYALADFFEWRSGHFLKEFGSESKFLLSLDRKYRSLAKSLAAVLTEDSPEQSTAQYRAGRFMETVAYSSDGSASWGPEKRWVLIADLIHMQVNRLFSHDQRQHEAFIIYCLGKYWTSVLARRARR